MDDKPGQHLNGVGLWFGLLATPFFLNDFSNIFISDYRIWLAVDYIFVKFLPTALIVYALQTKRLQFADLGLKMPTLPPTRRLDSIDDGDRDRS